LKSEAPRFTRRNISATIAADAKRFCHQTAEIFGTHRRYFPSKLEYWVLRIRHRGHACCIEERTMLEMNAVDEELRELWANVGDGMKR